LTSDIMTILMFSRVYFLLVAFLMLSPTMDLQGKRTLIINKIEPSYSFQIRACMTKYPMQSYIALFGVSVTLFAYIMQICERPYYELTLSPK